MSLLLEPVATPHVEEAKREMKVVLWNWETGIEDHALLKLVEKFSTR
jgi:hypothetical protein